MSRTAHKYPPDPLPPVLLGGTINLLAGAPGTGKSTFCAWLARQVKEKTPLWGREWGEVPWQGVLCADRSWYRSTKLWFELEGMQEIPAYSMQDDVSFKKQRLRAKHQRISIFESCLDKLAPGPSMGLGKGEFPLGALVYVDPLALFLGGNLLDYDTCAVACSELREICLERGITVIGTAHASKQKADKRERYLRLQDRILGSAALFGYTDTQMYMASPEEIAQPFYAFLWCPHHAPTATFEFTRKADGRFLPGKEIVEKRLGQEQPDFVPEVPDWLQAALDTGNQSFSALIALASANDWSRATLKRRLDDMLRHNLLVQPKHGLYGKPQPN